MRGHSKMVLLLLPVVATGALWAQAQEQNRLEQAIVQATEKAREAAATLTRTLLGELTQHLREGGPENAVHVCSEKAQELTQALQQEGLRIRRVSLRPRNPLNRPDEFEKAKLAEMEKRYLENHHEASEVSEWLLEGHTLTLRYLKPIVISDLCLACHGDPKRMKPAVRDFLAAHYPEDQAVGYQAGQFRGAISVTVTMGLDPESPKP